MQVEEKVAAGTKSDGTSFTTTRSPRNQENAGSAEGEVTSQNNENPAVSEQDLDLLLTKAVENLGREVLTENNQKVVKCGSPWKESILKNPNENNKLLISLGRMLARTVSICVCMKKQEGELQLAFSNKKCHEQGSLLMIRELARKRQRLTGVTATQREELIESISQQRNLLLKRAIHKDRAFLGQSKCTKIRELLESERECYKQFEQFKNAIKAFCQKEGKRQKGPPAEENFSSFANAYHNYWAALSRLHSKKLTATRGNPPGQSLLNKMLFLPFLNVYDVELLFSHVVKNSASWQAIAKIMAREEAEAVRIILPEEQKHAEMKILEHNNFQLEVFSSGPWKAVITKNPCVSCWLLLCASTNDEQLRTKITAKLGGLAVAYPSWKSPDASALSQPQRTEIWNNNRRLLREQVVPRIEEKNFKPGKRKRAVNEEVQEVTMIQYLVVDQQANQQLSNQQQFKQKLREQLEQTAGLAGTSQLSEQTVAASQSIPL